MVCLADAAPETMCRPVVCCCNRHLHAPDVPYADLDNSWHLQNSTPTGRTLQHLQPDYWTDDDFDAGADAVGGGSQRDGRGPDGDYKPGAQARKRGSGGRKRAQPGSGHASEDLESDGEPAEEQPRPRRQKQHLGARDTSRNLRKRSKDGSQQVVAGGAEAGAADGERAAMREVTARAALQRCGQIVPPMYLPSAVWNVLARHCALEALGLEQTR